MMYILTIQLQIHLKGIIVKPLLTFTFSSDVLSSEHIILVLFVKHTVFIRLYPNLCEPLMTDFTMLGIIYQAYPESSDFYLCKQKS